MIEPAEKVRKLTPYQQCETLWQKRHMEVFGVPFLGHHRRDTILLRPILAGYGALLTLELIGYFFDEQQNEEREPGSSARWIGRASATFKGFVGQIPNILKSYTLENRPDGG